MYEVTTSSEITSKSRSSAYTKVEEGRNRGEGERDRKTERQVESTKIFLELPGGLSDTPNS